MTEVVGEIKARMGVTVLEEGGFAPALLGLGLSHGLTSGVSFNEMLDDDLLMDRLLGVQSKLASKEGGHNKFLESIQVWIDIEAPRYWWQEADTYRVGTTKQSESTMHTISYRYLTQADFVRDINQVQLDCINDMIENHRSSKELKDYWFLRLKGALPEGFMQRRIVSTNYKVLRNMWFQRRHHRLPEWAIFFKDVLNQVTEPALITTEVKKEKK